MRRALQAMDQSINGTAAMRVLAESSFAINDVKGRELDEGAMHRVLAEMMWFPTAYLDGRYVSWKRIDREDRLRLTAC
jgi:hypothetical protein